MRIVLKPRVINQERVHALIDTGALITGFSNLGLSLLPQGCELGCGLGVRLLKLFGPLLFEVL